MKPAKSRPATPYFGAKTSVEFLAPGLRWVNDARF